MDLAAIRAEIPALAKTTYLNTAGIGPSPRVVTETIVRLYRQVEADSPDLMAEVARVAAAVRAIGAARAAVGAAR